MIHLLKMIPAKRLCLTLRFSVIKVAEGCLIAPPALNIIPASSPQAKPGAQTRWQPVATWSAEPAEPTH
jgi:hypothetical protein